jgi:phosphoesterase RecJ-like protein
MYQELKNYIQNSGKITLVSHVAPDADALGSSLAFYLALKRMGKNVKIYNSTKVLAKKYDFLPSYKSITNIFPQNSDLVISFDSGSFKRLDIKRGDYKLINIDHHKSNEIYADLNIVDPTHASTSSVVYDIFKSWDISISRDIALCIYTALVEDTNFFSDSSTDERVFSLASELTKLGARPEVVGENLTQRNSLAKLRLDSLFIDSMVLKKDAKVAIGEVSDDMLKKSGALRYDTAHLADILQSLATVEFSIFTLEMDDGIVKFSLRSKSIDVSTIALKFGGGGHSRSAGFSVDATKKDEIIEKILGDLDI